MFKDVIYVLNDNEWKSLHTSAILCQMSRQLHSLKWESLAVELLHKMHGYVVIYAVTLYFVNIKAYT